MSADEQKEKEQSEAPAEGTQSDGGSESEAPAEGSNDERESSSGE